MKCLWLKRHWWRKQKGLLFPSKDDSTMFTVLQIYLIDLVFPYAVVCETWTWLINYFTGCVFNSTWAFLEGKVAKSYTSVVAKFFYHAPHHLKFLSIYPQYMYIYLFITCMFCWSSNIFFLHPDGLSCAHPEVCAPRCGDHCYRFTWSCMLEKKLFTSKKFKLSFLSVWVRKLPSNFLSPFLVLHMLSVVTTTNTDSDHKTAKTWRFLFLTRLHSVPSNNYLSHFIFTSYNM